MPPLQTDIAEIVDQIYRVRRQSYQEIGFPLSLFFSNASKY
jgi:hypothetical protein